MTTTEKVSECPGSLKDEAATAGDNHTMDTKVGTNPGTDMTSAHIGALICESARK